MNRQHRQPRTKSPRGRYKCGIYFIDHRIQSGRAFYMYSTEKQDQTGRSLNRFKRMISHGNFKGKVNHATIYENGQPIYEFTAEQGTWQRLDRQHEKQT